MSTSELETDFKRQAKEFKALQKIMSKLGNFEAMQIATICAGLSEVCEMLAEEAKRGSKGGSKDD